MNVRRFLRRESWKADASSEDLYDKSGPIKVLSRKQDKSRPIFVPFLILLLALIYDIMPFDFMPDVPVVGWVDDLLITAAAMVNFVEKTILHKQQALQSAVWKIKWVVILFSAFSLAFMFLFIIALVKIITM